MKVSTPEQKEADAILHHLIESGYSFVHINNIYLISCKNEDFQPDSGANPRLACTIEDLIGAMQRNNKVRDWSTINETE